MTDSLKTVGKKALSWSVVSTTIAWSLGASALLAPLSASAAIPGAGSLIKLTCTVARPDVNDPCKAVYYLAANGKRYVFPHEKTYKTWYPDFSGVVNLSFDELSSISIGGNVVYRPGTRLVKITTDKNVYAAEPGGKLRKIPSEAVASQLYGSTWAQRVDDVADPFFTNYSVMSDVEAGKYPTGSLVKTAASADVWYIDGMTRRKVTAEGFTANRFRNEFVITTSVDVAALTAGTDLSTSEFADTSQSGLATPGAPGGPAVGGTGLTVSTASDTAAARAVVTDSSVSAGACNSSAAPCGGEYYVPFAKVHFTASADGPVTVNEITASRGGISADADIAQLYLYDGDNLQQPLVESGAVSSGRVKFSGGSAGLFTIPAGGSKDITIRGNIAATVDSGKTISFSVLAADVKTAGTVSVSGSAAGSTFTVASVSNLGQAQFRNVTPTAATEVDPQDNYELWRFSYTSAEQDQTLKALTLTQVGSVDGDDIQNFKLMDGTTQLGSTVPTLSNNKLTFDLGAGLNVTSGMVKQLSVRGDIKGGTNRTFRFSIQNRYDVIVWDKNYNVYAPVSRVTNAGSNSNAFSVIEPNDGTSAVNATIRTGRLVIATAADSPSSNVPDGATNVTLAKFAFTAAGEDIKINSIVANCSMNVTSDILVNGKMYLDGSQVGATDATATCDAAQDISFTFGTSFIIPAGSTKVLEFHADLTDSTVGAADTIQINLEAGSSNAEGRVSLTSISTGTASGRTVTVRANAVTVARNPSVTDWSSSRPTAVLGGSNKLIASFTITGGGEDADVTQIVINDDVGGDDSLADAFNNLKLVADDGVQFGSTVGTLTDTQNTNYTFTPNQSLRVLAGNSRVINVFADVRNPLGASALIANFQSDRDLNVASVTATGVLTGTDASDTASDPTSQAIYLAIQGNLSITLDGSNPRRSTEVMGSSGVELSRIKLAADVNEDINVTRLIVVDTLHTVSNNNPGAAFGSNATGATGTLKNIKLINVATGNQVGGTVVGLQSNTTYSTSTPAADFDNIQNLIVPRDGSVVLKVVADVQTFTLGGVSSSTHRMSMRTNYTGASTTAQPVTATGRDSGISVSRSCLDIGTAAQGACPGSTQVDDNGDSDVNGNFHDVFRTKLTVALAPGSPTGSKSPTSNQTVAIFRVSNSANVGNYDATLELMNLDIGGTLSPTCTGTADSTCSAIALYKDDTSSVNQLWTTTATETSNTYLDSQIADATQADEVIASGGFKDFFATVGTNQSTGSAGSSRSLTVSLDNGDIEWGDGTTTSITLVDSLPVNGNTLTYSF